MKDEGKLVAFLHPSALILHPFLKGYSVNG
jgi:hypothetical protein